jgi:hypothetical protein
MTGLIAADRDGLIANCDTDSSSLRRSPFPPVRRRPLGNDLSGEHDVGEVAELPQFVRGTAVLEDGLIGVERVQIAGAKTIQRFRYTPDKLTQTRLVIRRNHLACGPSLRLGRHEGKATNLRRHERPRCAALAAAVPGVPSRGRPRATMHGCQALARVVPGLPRKRMASSSPCSRPTAGGSSAARLLRDYRFAVNSCSAPRRASRGCRWGRGHR